MTARALGAAGLCAIALIHLLDLSSTFGETPYVGWLYVALIAACLALAVAVVRTGRSLVWGAAGWLSAIVMLCFVLSRTTGLPGATRDIGNWAEPLGLAALMAEALVAALSWRVLAIRAEAKAQVQVHPPRGQRSIWVR